jgi:ATP-dependent Lon protease
VNPQAGRHPNALLPVLPLPDVSLFPEASLSLAALRPAAAQAVAIARRTGRRLLALALKQDSDSPSQGNLFEVGTVAHVTATDATEERTGHVELDGLSRARLITLVGRDSLVAEVETIEEGDPGDEWGNAVEALARYMHGHVELRRFLEQQRRSDEPMAWVNLACQHLPITASARQKLLEADAPARCFKIGRGLDALLKKERAT